MKPLWTITPHDTLALGNGTLIEGASSPARALELPWPSTVSGYLRHRRYEAASVAEREGNLPEWLRTNVSSEGPWLAVESDDGVVEDLLVPAPLDCIWHEGPGGHECRRLKPTPLQRGEESDLPYGLMHVGFDGELPQAKPAAPPPYWSWQRELKPWLKGVAPKTNGHPGLIREMREHVAIDEKTGTARPGALFRAEHIRYTSSERGQLSIAFLSDALDDVAVAAQPWTTLGGERRIASIRKSVIGPQFSFACPELSAEAKHARVLVITPALFDEGAVPLQIGEHPVVAAAVGRAIVVSGWDFVRNAPKHTKRAAPAGSVYWVDLDGESLQNFAQRLWLTSISSTEQDRCDGFGISIVGAP